MLIHSTSSINYSQGQQSAVSLFIMSDQSDSQNQSEQLVHMSEGTSPSSSSDDGSRSTPSNLPKAATRQRKKRTSDSKDEDYVADEATSKRVVRKKEYGSAAATKPGMHKKAPARRVPTSKPRKAVLEETMKFTMESEGEDIGQGKKKKRARTTIARVIGKSSMRKDSDEKEEEEEGAAPAPKAPKLMGDAIRSGAAASKP